MGRRWRTFMQKLVPSNDVNLQVGLPPTHPPIHPPNHPPTHLPTTGRHSPSVRRCIRFSRRPPLLPPYSPLWVAVS